ncbi:hypothetical protein CYMTET_30347 [Cymbomonas tetramitiformis]|uniref:Uncharacterized protein n=1 Tax=Cymbomonas tetramitiformis TaxID=36881 RepID=A0AAE0FJ78_9CHLO|nr:hypothetical protein CYMTET_30347 [Cymbomonas tetramitiformis]
MSAHEHGTTDDENPEELQEVSLWEAKLRKLDAEDELNVQKQRLKVLKTRLAQVAKKQAVTNSLLGKRNETNDTKCKRSSKSSTIFLCRGTMHCLGLPSNT